MFVFSFGIDKTKHFKFNYSDRIIVYKHNSIAVDQGIVSKANNLLFEAWFYLY